MVDMSPLQVQFAGSAGLREQKRKYETQLEKAQEFVEVLDGLVAKGSKPAAAEVQQGLELLKGLNEGQREVYAFNSAILAGQEVAEHKLNDAGLEQRLDSIDKAVKQADVTTARLRQTLKGLS